MSKATVAIVGRPNVGKSTLFNRLIGGRAAIVSEHAGTTRDRHFGEVEWGGREFYLIDTGGLVPGSKESTDKAIRHQVELALDSADLIMLVVDGIQGLSPIDAAIADTLRSLSQPVLVVVNKVDNLLGEPLHYDFYGLGLGDPIPVSAATGKASGDLLDAVVARLPDRKETGDRFSKRISVALVGRPNAGKSSLANRLLGQERFVVSAIAGTTRDATDSLMIYHDYEFRFVDTAGLRRKARVEEDVEFYSTLRTHRAIDAADVCVLVVDASIGLHNQDLRIANHAWEKGCGLIIAVTKWDLIAEKDANTAQRGQSELMKKAPFLADVPFVYVSALTGQRVRKILDLVLEVWQARNQRIATAEVNRVLAELVDAKSPPQLPGEPINLLYASQISVAPPGFVVVANRPDGITEAYQRYLLNGFRRAWRFLGCPIRLKFKARSRRGNR